MIDDKQTQIVNKLAELLEDTASWEITGETSMTHTPTGLRIGYGETWACIHEGLDTLKIEKEDALLLIPKMKLINDVGAFVDSLRVSILERMNKEVPDVRNDSTNTASE